MNSQKTSKLLADTNRRFLKFTAAHRGCPGGEYDIGGSDTVTEFVCLGCGAIDEVPGLPIDLFIDYLKENGMPDAALRPQGVGPGSNKPN